MFSPLTKQLIDALQCLPGIGPKSAQRMAFHLLEARHKAKGTQLANSLQEALARVTHCQSCRIYTEHPICDLCKNIKRDASILCVVESPSDVVALEQTQTYNGKYFVLQGHLSPLDGIGPQDIGIPILLEKLKNEDIHELILATNPTMEGKATAHYIATHATALNIHCSRIAQGVPIGGELEYLDSNTLAHALRRREPLTTE
ncbi:MAG: recombination protein RecR [Coxiella sp. (in: Bacteria)]|nr:MAG: recombination protein RecR [Coxiella sp. (in: g-proteobacteria)]